MLVIGFVLSGEIFSLDGKLKERVLIALFNNSMVVRAVNRERDMKVGNRLYDFFKEKEDDQISEIWPVEDGAGEGGIVC